jgi:carbamoyltransferase
MFILGINAYHGDVSAVLVRDGELVAAVEEERFRRIKHVAGFPREAICACLAMAGIRGRDVQHVAVSRDPRANAARKAWYAATVMPTGRLLKDRAKNYHRVGNIPDTLRESLALGPHDAGPRIHWVEHHPAHLASTFFPSPYDDAAVCAIDGFGDFVSTSWAVGRGSSLDVIDRTYFPHSLGILYLAITQYLGFMKYGDEFKVMGLAPYGVPDYAEQLQQLVHLLPGGKFELDLAYFRHWSGGSGMTWTDGEPKLEAVYSDKLVELLGPARQPAESLTVRHEVIAASLQLVFEECVFHVLNGLYEATRIPRLCLSGGCAMNSVANGKIREQTDFRDVFIQPASGDNGTALGAAYWVWNQVLKQPRKFSMSHAYFGPAFGREAIEHDLGERAGEMRGLGCVIRASSGEQALCDEVARRLAEGQVVGWFQGRMEWGARALGNRSILADPRRPDMREIINAKIKLREKFRPFAPSVLEEAHGEYFVGSVPDPFMIHVYQVREEKRDVIPAVTHIDGSGRLQTVSRGTNPIYWNLIKAFERLTGVPVVLNTSFNENEPIVHRPAEAIDCFMRTRMDALVLGEYLIAKPATAQTRASDGRPAAELETELTKG